MPIVLDLLPAEEKPQETPAPKTLVVRYGYLREIGEFPSDIVEKVVCGSKVVCRTERGTEITELLTTTCANGGCGKAITREKMLAYFESSGGREYPFTVEGRVLRVATAQDLAEQVKLEESRKKDIQLARELTAQHHLAIKIVEVEYLLGRERVLFYFTSENRVDFRQLVRDLAHQLHARIELRQVGARDDARITADYEKCGQHCCCKQFLKVLTPVSMRSAKVQKATLDPAKISGRCGRLMCCLRYEDMMYEELRKKLPKKNTRVKTEAAEGWVVDGQILTQLVLVQYDDGRREAVPMEKILGFDLPKPKFADGRTMQSPNDRPPEVRRMPVGPGGPGGPAGAAGGNVPPGPGNRPAGPARPVGVGGGPAVPAVGGQQQQRGPGAPPPPRGSKAPPPPPSRGKVGGPAKAGGGAGPQTGPQSAPPPAPKPVAARVPDEIDDMIADAMDDSPPVGKVQGGTVVAEKTPEMVVGPEAVRLPEAAGSAEPVVRPAEEGGTVEE